LQNLHVSLRDDLSLAKLGIEHRPGGEVARERRREMNKKSKKTENNLNFQKKKKKKVSSHTKAIPP
jgi:hypothetical protein